MALDLINIPNTVGATLRENINDALDAVSTTFSGETPPTTTNTGLSSVIGVLWFDTSINALKVNIGTDAAPNFVLVDTQNPGTVTSITPGVGFASNTTITSSGTMNLQAGTNTEFGGLKVRFLDGVLFIRNDGANA